jgi:dTDP-glucose 4,6-dehydratase
MRILVTGGAGFIGSNFIEMLFEKYNEQIETIIALDKLTYAGKKSNLGAVFSNKNFEFIHGDICDFDKVSNISERVDCIINFAAETHVDKSIMHSKNFIVSNVVGTQVLLDCAIKHKIKKFIQISTDEVYGSISEGSWDENCPVKPNSPYSASKSAADLLVYSYFITHGLDVSITRSSNNFGPRQNFEKFIPNLIYKLSNGLKGSIYGNGNNIRDWIYVRDNCEAIYKVLIKGGRGQIYNIGGSNELTNIEIAKKVLSLMNLDEDMIEYVKDRPGHDYRYSVKVDKVRNLGFVTRNNFDDSLKSTVEWYMKYGFKEN